MLDAYTIRKIAPRILIGVILINLSIYLCVAAIDVTNAVGHGLTKLITQPFDFDKLSPDAGSGNVFAIMALIGGLVTIIYASLGLGLALLGIGGLMILTIMVIVLMIMITLIIRQSLLIFLSIISPVAVALYIFPGTEKYAKQWWDLMVKTLMVYPIVSAIFAISGVMATIAFDSTDKPATGDLEGAFNVLVGILLVYIPLFLIPFAFKFAGGVVGTVAGMANSPLARLSKSRSQVSAGARAKNMQAMKDGNRFEGKGWIPGSQRAARRFNATTRGLGTGVRGNFGIGSGQGAAAQGLAIDRAAGNLTKTAGWQAMKENDGALKAATYNTEQEALQKLQSEEGMSAADALSAVQNFKASGAKFGDQAAQYAAAKQLVSTGTGYKDIKDMAKTFGRVSRGNDNIANSLSGFGNYEAKTKGRWDLAAGYGEVSKLSRQENAAQHSGGSAPTQAAYDAATVQAIGESTDAGTLARTAKPQVLKNFNDVQTRVLGPNSQYDSSDPKVQKLKSDIRARNIELGDQRYGMSSANAEIADKIRREHAVMTGDSLPTAAPDRMGADQSDRARTYGGNMSVAEREEMERRRREGGS